MTCPTCGHDPMQQMGCRVTEKPFHWCVHCGTVRPCEDVPAIPPVLWGEYRRLKDSHGGGPPRLRIVRTDIPPACDHEFGAGVFFHVASDPQVPANYQGGEVVDAAAYDALIADRQRLVDTVGRYKEIAAEARDKVAALKASHDRLVAALRGMCDRCHRCGGHGTTCAGDPEFDPNVCGHCGAARALLAELEGAK